MRKYSRDSNETLLYLPSQSRRNMRKMSIQRKNDEEYNVRGNRRCGLFGLVMKMRIWVGLCSEIGPAVRASSRCAGGIVIIVCEGGRVCASESEVAYLSSPFRTKKKEKKEEREREGFRRHVSTFEERWRRRREGRAKKGTGRRSRTSKP